MVLDGVGVSFHCNCYFSQITFCSYTCCQTVVKSTNCLGSLWFKFLLLNYQLQNVGQALCLPLKRGLENIHLIVVLERLNELV